MKRIKPRNENLMFFYMFSGSMTSNLVSVRIFEIPTILLDFSFFNVALQLS